MQHCTLFRGGALVSFGPPRVEHADLVVADGRVVKKGARLSPPPGAEVVDVRGRILIPGLVDAHLDATGGLARLLPPTEAAQFEGAQSEESLICAAFASALEAVRAGATTFVVRHSSPAFTAGSLTRLRDVFATLGVRFVASYAATDDGPPESARAALDEQRFASAFGAAPRMRFLLGLGSSTRVSPAYVKEIAELSRATKTPPHVAVGFESKTSAEAHEEVARLFEAGFVLTNAVVACGPAVLPEDAAVLRAAGAVLVHLPSDGGSGPSAASPFVATDALGSGSGRPDLFEAARTALVAARARGFSATPEDALALLGGGHELASRLFDRPFGTLDPGAPADIVVLDYRPSTPLVDETVARHIIGGVSAAHVQHVVVDGRVVLRDRQFPRVEIRQLYRQLERGALDLFVRAAGGVFPGIDRDRDELPSSELADLSEPTASSHDVHESALEIEPLPSEEVPGEPWRIRGGDRGSDSEAVRRSEHVTRSVRNVPPPPPPPPQVAPPKPPRAPKPERARKAERPAPPVVAAAVDVDPTSEAEPIPPTEPTTPPEAPARTDEPAAPSDPFGFGIA